MKLEKQVCSLELAQKLALAFVNAGHKSPDSAFTWVESTEKEGEYKLESFHTQFYGVVHDYWAMGTEINVKHPMYPAFTVAELGERLPKEVTIKALSAKLFIKPQNRDGWAICYIQNWSKAFTITDENLIVFADTEADARAKMLIYLLENNLINHA